MYFSVRRGGPGIASAIFKIAYVTLSREFVANGCPVDALHRHQFFAAVAILPCSQVVKRTKDVIGARLWFGQQIR